MFKTEGSSQILEAALVIDEGRIPAGITSSRVAVIVDSDRDWKELSEKAHSNFRKMGIDAMLYVNYESLHGGQAIERLTLQRLRKRQVELLAFLSDNNGLVELTLTDMGKNQLVNTGSSAWRARGNRLIDVLVTLGVQMKAMSLSQDNYLIADFPEYLDNLPIFRGSHYKTYPTRLKKVPLAVSLFPYWEAEERVQVSPALQKAMDNYNAEVDRKNDLLKAAFSNYPYKVEFITERRDELMYKDRYQFVLKYCRASGLETKKMLGYEIDDSEINYVSMIPIPNGKRMMKTIPRGNEVYKFYIKQTVAGDVHVGRYYDAEEDFSTALENFVKHMVVQFQK